MDTLEYQTRRKTSGQLLSGMDYPREKSRIRLPWAKLLHSAALIILLVLAAPQVLSWLNVEVPPSSGGAPVGTRAPHEIYAGTLEAAGIFETALGREWLAASREALKRTVRVDPPFQETGYLDPGEASAAGFRVSLEQGQLLIISLRVERDTSTLIFIDVFQDRGDTLLPPRAVASAAPDRRRLEHEARVAGDYLIRLQPELLRGGRYVITVLRAASLAFPVAGEDVEAIRSRFGAPRDGGRRDHHGVDIFARRGTPVIAAAEGVARAGTNRLGGNVVWLRDSRRNQVFYYAHLDAQAVPFRSTRVIPGDTLGFVGNSGNARSTPPHLHFGIYRRGFGPVDPFFFLYEPPSSPGPLRADTSYLGHWARTVREGVPIRWAARGDGEVMAVVTRHTALRVLGGSANWHRVALPSGPIGWVRSSLTEPLAEPVRHQVLSRNAALFSGPGSPAHLIDSLMAGVELPVLGQYGGYALVETDGGLRGWLLAGTGRMSVPAGAAN